MSFHTEGDDSSMCGRKVSKVWKRGRDPRTGGFEMASASVSRIRRIWVASPWALLVTNAPDLGCAQISFDYIPLGRHFVSPVSLSGRVPHPR
jgi:hypothetical protein